MSACERCGERAYPVKLARVCEDSCAAGYTGFATMSGRCQRCKRWGQKRQLMWLCTECRQPVRAQLVIASPRVPVAVISTMLWQGWAALILLLIIIHFI